MTTTRIIILIVAAGLFSWSVAVGWIDAALRRRDRELLEAREWAETVEAMRRMADQEGDA